MELSLFCFVFYLLVYAYMDIIISLLVQDLLGTGSIANKLLLLKNQLIALWEKNFNFLQAARVFVKLRFPNSSSSESDALLNLCSVKFMIINTVIDHHNLFTGSAFIST